MLARTVVAPALVVGLASMAQAAGFSASVTLANGTTVGGSAPTPYYAQYVAPNANGALQGSGAAGAGYGRLGVSDIAVGNWFANPPNVNNNGASSATSTASWSDAATVTSANRSGLAMLNFSFNVTGSVTSAATNAGQYSTTGSADFSLSLQINQQSYLLVDGASITVYPPSSTFTTYVNGQNASPIGTFHFSAPIVLGSDFSLSAELTGFASTSGIEGKYDDGKAFASGTVSAGYPINLPPALLGRSALDQGSEPGVFWGGVQSVTQDGVTIPFSMTSESGTDWTVSQIPVANVPEPASAGLLAAGLIALALGGRRRSR